MGGHGNGHEIKIPSPDTYKIENCPDLVKFQERLAKEGLKDPWLRNEVWRFDPAFGTYRSRALLLLRGWKLGVAATIITIGIDYLLAMGKEDQHDKPGHH